MLSPHPRGRARALAFALGVSILAGHGTPIVAQGTGGSEAGVSTGHGTLSAAGEAQSASFSLASGLSQVAGAVDSSSSNFQLRSGVTWVPATVATDQPLVFGTRANAGAAGGGDLVQVFGFNFTAPGAGTNSVDVAGSAATGTLTVSNTEIRAVTPAGVNGFGNPLASESVSVTNALGTDAANDAFTFQPALLLVDPVRVGTPIRIRSLAADGSLTFLMFGDSLAGVSLPVPPLDGALELVLGFEFITPLLPIPDGGLALSSGVLQNPAFAGVTVELQGLVFDDLSLTTGSFTNLLPIIVQS